jgi:hypothetical protein
MGTPFDLAFNPSHVVSGTVGSVMCEQLDAVLHPTGVLRVNFESSSAKSKDGTFVIESFQLQSLTHYLTNQQRVRREAETRLLRARTNWMHGDNAADPDVWADSALSELWLPTRTHNQFDGGGPRTESVYIVVFRVEWDEEHVRRTLKFRDDEFVSFGMDGE